MTDTWLNVAYTETRSPGCTTCAGTFWLSSATVMASSPLGIPMTRTWLAEDRTLLRTLWTYMKTAAVAAAATSRAITKTALRDFMVLYSPLFSERDGIDAKADTAIARARLSNCFLRTDPLRP